MNVLGATTPHRLIEWFCTVGLPDTAGALNRGDVDSPIYGLCWVYHKDDPPMGFDRLDTSWHGQSANINKGNPNLLSSAVYLCVSRLKANRRGVIPGFEQGLPSRSSDSLNAHPSPYAASPSPSSSSDVEAGESEKPIVDVIVLHVDKGERCPPGYQLVPTYGSGSQHRAFALHKYMNVAYSRSSTRPPLYEIALCRSSKHSSHSHSPRGAASSFSNVKGLVIPRFFQAQKRVLNPHITTTRPLYLCTRHAPSSLSCLPLQPTLLDRVPRSDVKGQHFPDVLSMMAFPEGILVQSAGKRPYVGNNVLTFVVTQNDGRRLYCVALTRWERASLDLENPLATMTHTERSSAQLRPDESSNTNAKNSSTDASIVGADTPSCPKHHVVRIPSHYNHAFSSLKLPVGHSYFVPKSIVLVSYYPYYNCFTQFLQALSSIIESPTPSFLPIERFLLNLWETPLPRVAHLAVQMKIMNDRITFIQPSHSEFPLADFSFLRLFELLSVDHVIDVIEAMLNEHRIILRSSESTLLTPVAEALCSLFFPLQWVSPYTPVIPCTNVTIVTEGGEMPMLGGANANYTPYPLLTSSMAFVDLDLDRVTVDADEKYARIPDDMRQRLKKELIEYAHVDTIEQKSPLKESNSSANYDSNAFNELACRAAFLHFFIFLLQGVDDFLLYPVIVDGARELDTSALFDLSGWLALPCHKHRRTILIALSRTQLFAQFIQDKTYQTNDSVRRTEFDFFHRCSAYQFRFQRQQKKLKQQSDNASSVKEMPNLLLYLSQRQINNQCFVVSGPISTGLEPSQTWLYYDRFPILDLSLFRHPRPITQAYLRQDASDPDTVRPEFQATSSSPRGRGEPVPLTTHASIIKNKNDRERDARPSSLQLSLTPVQPMMTLSPMAFALTLMRDVYATWFELWSICLPSHTDVAAGVVTVLEALARMTAQGVAPDEGIFRSALIICGRFGKKQEATAIFNTMTQRGVKPTPVTYAAYHMATLQQGHDGDEQPQFLRDSELIDITRESPHTAPPSATDPYRKQVERFSRLIRKSRRELVLWNSLRLAAFHRCVHCSFEISEAGVMTCWQLDQSKCHCPECGQSFQPTLRIACTIVTNPARLKALVSAHLLRRPLDPMYCRYHITLPLLPPSKLRREFLSAAQAFREDFLAPSTFRVMHEVTYWNLLYQLSHSQNVWDLNFVVNLPLDELKRFRVRRLRRTNWLDDDDQVLLGCDLPQAVQLKVRTIEGSEGLRDRELANLSAARTFDYRDRVDNDSDEDSEILISTGNRDLSKTCDVMSSPSISSIRSLTPVLSGSEQPDSAGLEQLSLTPARRDHGPDWTKEREITMFLQRQEVIKAMQFFLNCRIEARSQEVNQNADSVLSMNNVSTPVNTRTPNKSVISSIPTPPQQTRYINHQVKRSAAEQPSPSLKDRLKGLLPHPPTRLIIAADEHSPNTPLSARAVATAASALHSFAVRSIASSNWEDWLPIRDASPMSRLHNRCMFECFVMLGLRYFDSYAAMSEMFTASVNKLDGRFLSALTTMDLAPSPTVLTIEVTLGIKRRASKRRVDAETGRLSNTFKNRMSEEGEALLSLGTSSTIITSQRSPVPTLPHSLSLSDSPSYAMSPFQSSPELKSSSPIPPPVAHRFDAPEEFAGSVSDFLANNSEPLSAYASSPSSTPLSNRRDQLQNLSPAFLDSPHRPTLVVRPPLPTHIEQPKDGSKPVRKKRLSQTRSAVVSNDDINSLTTMHAPIRKKSMSHQSLERAVSPALDSDLHSSPNEFVRAAGNEIKSGVERLIGFLRKPNNPKSNTTTMMSTTTRSSERQ